jgi:hypothetical protein
MNSTGFIHTFHTEKEVDMSAAMVIPIRPARSEKIDLAWALAVLSKGVEAHERVRGPELALSVPSLFELFRVYLNAKPLGA